MISLLLHKTDHEVRSSVNDKDAIRVNALWGITPLSPTKIVHLIVLDGLS